MEFSNTNPTSILVTRKHGQADLAAKPVPESNSDGKAPMPQTRSSVVMVDRVHPAMVERFGNKDQEES